MAQDPIGQGERFSYYEKSIGKTTVDFCCPEHDYAGTQCWSLGDGLARYFVHDAMRGIDYLMTRPEVDPAKIGITGNGFVWQSVNCFFYHGRLIFSYSHRFGIR